MHDAVSRYLKHKQEDMWCHCLLIRRHFAGVLTQTLETVADMDIYSQNNLGLTNRIITMEMYKVCHSEAPSPLLAFRYESTGLQRNIRLICVERSLANIRPKASLTLYIWQVLR